MSEKPVGRPEILKHDAGYFDGEQYVFNAEEIKACIDWADQIEEQIEVLRKSEDYYKTGARQTGKQAGRPLYVPKRISIPRRVRSDVPRSRVSILPGEYDAHVNQYGAVSIKLGDDEFLGIMLYEFDVLEWQENPALRGKEEVR